MVNADSIGPKVTFGPLDPGFGTGTTPMYQAVQGPDPLAILAVVTCRSRWLLRTRYRLQLTPGCARRQKHHHRRSSNRKPKFKFKIAKLGKLHSSELRRLGLLLCSLDRDPV